MRAPADRDKRPDDRPVVRAVPCEGHAFDEDLVCPCGTTWFEHQASRGTCPIGAQRCKRARTEDAEGSPGGAATRAG